MKDQGHFTSNNRLNFYYWSQDNESDLKTYIYSIGTAPGLTNVVNWKTAGLQEHIQVEVPDTNGNTYYMNVRVTNRAGRMSDTGYSNGITFDSTAPVCTFLHDEGNDKADPTMLKFYWLAKDDESGIVEYQYSIGTSPGMHDLISWTSVGSDTALYLDNLNLQTNNTYYLNLKTRNGAQIWSSVVSSNGLMIKENGLLYSENFEHNTLLGWDVNNYTFETGGPSASGQYISIHYPLGQLKHSFTNYLPETVRFSFKIDTFSEPQFQIGEYPNRLAQFHITDYGTGPMFWFGSNAFDVEFRAWYTIEVTNINWDQKVYDLYVNGQLKQLQIPFVDTGTTHIPVIGFFSGLESVSIDNVEVYGDTL